MASRESQASLRSPGGCGRRAQRLRTDCKPSPRDASQGQRPSPCLTSPHPQLYFEHHGNGCMSAACRWGSPGQGTGPCGTGPCPCGPPPGAAPGGTRACGRRPLRRRSAPPLLGSAAPAARSSQSAAGYLHIARGRCRAAGSSPARCGSRAAGPGPGGQRLGHGSARLGSVRHSTAWSGTAVLALTWRKDLPLALYMQPLRLLDARMTLSGLGCRLQTCSCLATEWFNSTFRARGWAVHPDPYILGWWEKKEIRFPSPGGNRAHGCSIQTPGHSKFSPFAAFPQALHSVVDHPLREDPCWTDEVAQLKQAKSPKGAWVTTQFLIRFC